MIKFKIISIFPEMFLSYCQLSIIKRAQDLGAIELEFYNLRDWTTDVHRSVDDKPFGGGAGMVMKIEPLYRALKDIAGPKAHKVLLSARGTTWCQPLAQKYATKYEEVVLICGRYEGVDERLLSFIDQEISIGDYVLTGGELGALVMIDSVARLLPKVLGNSASLESESHNETGVLEYPQYTRPEIFKAGRKEMVVPAVLTSGNHAQILKWQKENQRHK